MPWNEPGDPSKNKDPWTGRPKQTPPDLEAFLRDLCKKIVALFKLKIFNKKAATIAKIFPAQINTKVLGLISIFCVFAWLMFGFFKVNAAEQAVITRFGQYNVTLAPGYHWILRPIEQYTLINSGKLNKFSTTVDLLTRDENKISVAINLDYSIVNAHNYLFTTTHPLLNLQEVTSNAVNRVLSQFTLAQLLTTSSFSLQERLQHQLNALMTQGYTGLAIKNIELQTIQVPEQLKASFADAAKAQRDKDQLENQARAYALQVEPLAKAEALRLIADAQTYQQNTLLKAKTETTRFLALLPAYELSPSLTRKRLSLNALQAMMSHSNKLIIANPGTNINFSLTLDKSLATPAINPTKLTLAPITNDKNTTLAANTHAKTNTIPSSYNITGGYE